MTALHARHGGQRRSTMMLPAVLLPLLLLLLPLLVAGLPRGFVREVVGDRMETATAGAFAPNPRFDDHRPMLLVASPRGGVRVLENPFGVRTGYDDEVSNRILDLEPNLCGNGDRGLRSIAVHPDFRVTRWVYLYYTRRMEVWGCLEDSELGPRNVLARYTMNSTTLALEEEEILADLGVLSTSSNNGGALAFGTDGLLYLATGDGGVPEIAPDRRSLHGKLLRMRDDGTVPEDNPYSALGVPCGQFGGTVPSIFREDDVDVFCSEVFAWGFRNPIRMGVPEGDSATTAFSVVDAGGDFEEVSHAGTDFKERDYGWPGREGPCITTTAAGIEDCRPPPPGSYVVDPYHYYRSAGSAAAAAVGALAVVPSGIWPDKYRQLLLNANRRTIHALLSNPDAECRSSCSPPTPGYTNTTFYDEYLEEDDEFGNAPTMVDMFFGPYKDTHALYILQNGRNGDNSILRIRYIGLPPVAIMEVEVDEPQGKNKTTGSLPTSSTNVHDADLPSPPRTSFLVGDAVHFDGSGSFDPDGDELLFQWDFGDRTDSTNNASTPHHIYDAPGNYTVIMVVSNTRHQAQLASTTVSVGTAPSVAMLSPREGDLFAAGEPLRLDGEAFDHRGDRIPDNRLVWEVRRYLPDGGFESVLEATTGNGLDVDPLPEQSAPSSSNTRFVRVILFVADDHGLTARVVTDVYPVEVELVTEPEGLTIAVGNDELVAPTQIQTWVSSNFPVWVAREQPPYRFHHWSDGNTDSNRTISMPSDGCREPEITAPEASSRIAARPNRTVLTLEAIFCLIDDEPCRGVSASCCSGFCDDDGSCRPRSSVGENATLQLPPVQTNAGARPVLPRPDGTEPERKKPANTTLTVAKGEFESDRTPAVTSNSNFTEGNEESSGSTTNETVAEYESEPDRKPVVANATEITEGDEESVGATIASETVSTPEKDGDTAYGMGPLERKLIIIAMATLLTALLCLACKYIRLKVRLETESHDSQTAKESRQEDLPPQSIECETPPRNQEESTVKDSTDDTKRSFSSSNMSLHSAVSTGNASSSRFSGGAASLGDVSSMSPIWEKLALENERRAKLRARLRSSPDSTARITPDTPQTVAESFPESPEQHDNDDSASAPSSRSSLGADTHDADLESPPPSGAEDEEGGDHDSFVPSALSQTSILNTNIEDTLVRMDDLLSKLSARKQARKKLRAESVAAASLSENGKDDADDEEAAVTAQPYLFSDDGDDDDASEASGHATHPAPIWLQRESSAPGSPSRHATDRLQQVTRSFSMSSQHTASGSSVASTNDGSTTSSSSRVKWLSELPNTSMQSLLLFQDNTEPSISSQRTVRTTGGSRDEDDDNRSNSDLRRDQRMESGLAEGGSQVDHSFERPDDGEALLRILGPVADE